VAERRPGSDRGRPAIDWEQAFHTYAALPDSERSYRAVADTYGVSVRTVETHGRKEHWKERLGRIKAEAAAAADEQLAESRAQKLAELELLIDASLTSYAQQLRAGSVRVAPVDLLRLFKLREELWAQEAAERSTQRADVNAVDLEDAEKRRRELIAALDEAGAFERLRNSITHSSEDEDVDEAQEEAA